LLQLSDILDTLEKSQPSENFTEMLKPLQEAGVHTPNEVLFCGKAMLVEWTRLPLHQVTVLYSYCEKPCVEKPVLLDKPISNTTTGNDGMDSSEGNADDND
jgi:hypothetical protein